MSHLAILFSALTLSFALLAGSGTALADLVILQGEVNFTQGPPLARGTRMEVEIVDADTAGQRRVASVLYAVEGPPPFRFSIGYDEKLARKTKRHRMRATIILGEQVLYREAAATSVKLDGAAGAIPQILMAPVGLPSGSESPLGRRWEMISLDREKVLEHARVIIEFREGATLTGTGGCNSLKTTFELSAERLVFKRPATSRRGCQSPVMRQERNVIRALEKTRSYRVDGDVLTLLDKGGLELARFRVALF